MASDPGLPHRWSSLDRAFARALENVPAESEPLTLLFSGGVDSGLLAWEFRQRTESRLLTVGVPGSSDLARAAPAAELVGLPWRGASLEDAGLRAVASRLAAELAAVPPGRRSIFLAFGAALAATSDRQVVLGQGPDELFLGYAHFRGLEPDAAEARVREDLARALGEDWTRTRAIAERLGKEVLAPFLDPGFVTEALAIPIRERMPDATSSKPAFRAWARHRGLPALLADAPKKALQYGSGIERWTRRSARVLGTAEERGSGDDGRPSFTPPP